MEIVLRLNGVETWYGSGCALRDLSFDIGTGQIVALLGSNGSGKTTVLKTIMRLVDSPGRQQPEKGTIEFMGRRIDRADTDEIVRMGIAYVPQGRELFPELTVREHLIIGAHTRRDRKAVRDDLDMVYRFLPILRERQHQQAGYLSGGEQQLLALGRALMSRPRLIMLDEPSLGLSPIMTREIFAMTREINREYGLSVLLVEQNVHMALHYADYALLLANGRLVEADSAEILRESKAVKDIYLGIIG